MRRRRSDELPRFVDEPSLSSFQWRRRYTYYLLGFIVVCWFLYPSSRNTPLPPSQEILTIDWSRYAYSLYATDGTSLCHAVLLFDALARFGSKADRVLFYPEYWDLTVEDSKDRESQLLILARDTYKVKLQPTTVLTVEGRTKDDWTGTRDKSVTKLMAFSLEWYDRVIALDLESTLLQSIDELFLLPETPIAMPRAYLAEERPWPLSSALMVIKPNLKEYENFRRLIADGGFEMLVKAHRIDMELVNERFEDSALVLPHRPYSLITSEFRRHNHSAYLGDPTETWDAEKIYKEAKVVLFSDGPLPKPEIMWAYKAVEEMQPDCGGSHEGTCAERRIWKNLYDDFRHRRKDVCKLLSVPAPPWYGLEEELRMASGEPKPAAPAEVSASSDPSPNPTASGSVVIG
ncbi:hypothetical protein NX059_003341 [Plenodomus lindquistii]|nr:hypothetical protein NX059_003341 [Plenodomus lindquistii]